MTELARLQGMATNLQARAACLDAVRAFFRRQGFLAVDTPVRIPHPANEDYIDALASEGHFLRTSPELHMKRLLAAGYDRLFQLGPCFRAGERGRRHLPEFTILEWYRADADYHDILDDTRRLCVEAAGAVAAVANQCLGPEFFAREWEMIAVADAFRRHAGESLEQALSNGRFEHLLVERIEPNLGRDRPTVLIDYPVCQAALARRKADRPELAERWELYVHGLELANAYSELVDADEQSERFAKCARLRQADGRTAYPIDGQFVAALEHGLPPCGGIALGVDRLLMVLLGEETIDAVIAFPPEAEAQLSPGSRQRSS